MTSRNDFPWPNGKRAAVSLTYDDGPANNLDIALPALEAAGFRATFYLVTGSESMRQRLPDWRAAHARGHEIGNHSVTHPCRGIGKSKRPLEHYTPDEIAREVGEAAEWLQREIGPDPGRTYAYPCAHDAIGDPPDVESYARAVRQWHVASRLGRGDKPNDPWTLGPQPLRNFSFNNPPLADLIGWAEQALRANSWTILTFHGIGGPPVPCDPGVHQRFIDYLATAAYWVAPVRDIFQHVKQVRPTVL